MVDCIFVSKPKECNICLRAMKLQCLLNHQQLVVSEQGQIELQIILLDNINNPKRTKMESGQHGRVQAEGCNGC